MKHSATGGRRILIADDEQELRWMVRVLLKNEGFQALEAEDGISALDLMRETSPDCLLLDVRMPGMSGIEVLRRVRQFNRHIPVIVITGFGSIESAVEAVRNGASDYITKPLEHAKLIETIRQALASRHAEMAPRGAGRAAAAGDRQPTLREAMGPSDAVARVVTEAAQVAPTDFSVVISGETGSGKELVARAIHGQSRRAADPFVAVDCGCVPPTLFESELFGYERGAFTGADRPRAGLFEAASGGTLFLDEVSNLPLAVQPKLLRALQERQVHRVGGSRPIDVDVRVISAANCDLTVMMEARGFRRDLFFRLNEFGIVLPPLRERAGDVAYLARRFLTMTNEELGKDVRGISEAALEMLLLHRWPGNVRELRNVIRRAVLMADDTVRPEHLTMCSTTAAAMCAGRGADQGLDGGLSLKEIVRHNVMHVEQEVLAKVLRQTDGNKAEAARILQIDYKTMLNKTKAYGISR